MDFLEFIQKYVRTEAQADAKAWGNRAGLERRQAIIHVCQQLETRVNDVRRNNGSGAGNCKDK
jgi:hypothetical protein